MKEKFDRTKPHVNIGEIPHKEHGYSTTIAAFDKHTEDYERMREIQLRDLLEEYRLEEGKRRFDDLMQEIKERYQDFQKIDSVPEEKEFGVGPKMR